MSDPNSQYQPPAPPTAQLPEPGPQPTKLRPVAIVIFVIGILALVGGLAKLLPGGVGTGAIFCLWGIVMFGLSFVRYPETIPDAEPPMSPISKILGVFFEPSRVFRNLRVHPYWLAAFLVVAICSVAYTVAFVQRLTPERIVNYTMDKLADSPIKPPPEQMEKARDNAMQQAKQPIQRVQSVAKSFAGIFILGCIVAALYLLAIMVFGGRANFWQIFAVYFYASLPVVVIQKVISLIILFIKDPDDIHPIMGQETLVQDNLGRLFTPADHPVLFVGASVIGVLSFYGLWLRARGLQNGGTKVSSTAAWGATLSVFLLWLIFVLSITAIFPSFIS